jgi:hypothetical protein
MCEQQVGAASRSRCMLLMIIILGSRWRLTGEVVVH